MPPPPPAEKLHAACDECRFESSILIFTRAAGSRKLKCSARRPACAKCEKESSTCVYSPQKVMGRPRKRPREGEETLTGRLDGLGGSLDTRAMVLGFGVGERERRGLEMQSTLAGMGMGVGMGVGVGVGMGIYGPSPPQTSFDFGDTPPTDPSPWDVQLGTCTPQPAQQPTTQDPAMLTPPSHPPPPTGPCTCLSLTYLTLTELQTVPTFSFPQITIPLRRGTTTISTVLQCSSCPQDAFSAMQNVSALSSLFKALTSRLSQALREVHLEAARLHSARETKPYRIGDNSPALAHLHTGAPDCPLGFDVALEPGVWRALVKAALRTEVYGGGSNPLPLDALLREAEERQRRWHGDEGFLAEERKRLWGRECERDKMQCESLGGEHIRRAIEMLNWE